MILLPSIVCKTDKEVKKWADAWSRSLKKLEQYTERKLDALQHRTCMVICSTFEKSMELELKMLEIQPVVDSIADTDHGNPFDSMREYLQKLSRENSANTQVLLTELLEELSGHKLPTVDYWSNTLAKFRMVSLHYKFSTEEWLILSGLKNTYARSKEWGFILRNFTPFTEGQPKFEAREVEKYLLQQKNRFSEPSRAHINARLQGKSGRAKTELQENTESGNKRFKSSDRTQSAKKPDQLAHKCYDCGSNDHYRGNPSCPQYKIPEGNFISSDTNAQEVILDSGASAHDFSSTDWFTELDDQPREVRLAGNTILKTAGMGKVKLTVELGDGNTVDWTLEDALHSWVIKLGEQAVPARQWDDRRKHVER